MLFVALKTPVETFRLIMVELYSLVEGNILVDLLNEIMWYGKGLESGAVDVFERIGMIHRMGSSRFVRHVESEF